MEAIIKAIDIGVIQLAVAFFLLWYCFIILLWWWRRQKIASEMYGLIVVLIFSCIINSGFGLYIRLLGSLSQTQNHYHKFLHSPIWEWRYSFFNIAVLFIAYNITKKVLKVLKAEKAADAK